MLVVLVSVSACVSVQKTGKDTAPPPPDAASVMFDSRPGSAEVYVNGDFRGTTPISLRLPAGSHDVGMRLRDFESWQRELVVIAGDDTRVSATLRPLDD
jgi:hypothetical protein